MSRTKGALNKPKKNNGVFTMNFEKQILGSAVTKDSNRGWINYGAKNDYPNQLLNLYNQSPTLHACISFAVQSIIGDGVDYAAMKLDNGDIVPNAYETWDELLRKIATDYMIYGSYSLQIIKNRNNTDYSFYHIPYDQVRWGKYDEDGCITEYYVCQDWTQTAKYQPIRMDAFEMREDAKIAQGKPYLYVHKTYSPTMTYYNTPCYVSALKSIQAEVEMSNYDLKHIMNGFTTSGVLQLQPVDTEKDKENIIDNITRMFTSSDNANNIMITFGNGTGEDAISWTPLQSGAETSVNIYEDSNQRQINRILSTFQIPSRQLIGVPDQGGSGFNSEAEMLQVSYNLYQKLIGNYNRNCIVRSLNFMFKMNGVDTELILKPISFLDEVNTSNVTDDTDISVSDNVSSENIEEKVA